MTHRSAVKAIFRMNNIDTAKLSNTLDPLNKHIPPNVSGLFRYTMASMLLIPVRRSKLTW